VLLVEDTPINETLQSILLSRMGYEATQVIREMEQTRRLHRTPIIAVTANALKGDRERYFEAGMDGYVSKPLSMDSLKTEIDRVLAQARVLELAS
jgi:CheY-like chemotaxis protein